jgi:GH15 family glucan-1,4-alpha-glucosidase
MSHQDENFERDFWPAVRTIANHVARHWADRDQSMWEMRGPARQYTNSKAMCWMALDRAIGIARQDSLSAEVAFWQRERDLLRDSFLREGFNRELGAYTQYYGSDRADSSLLRLPLMGVARADDARMRGTIALIEKQLLRNGLLYRYNPAEDGIGEHEGAFTASSFWLVENYILQGRLREAEAMFRHVTSFANDVGLMSEELNAKTGEQMGNFPQGFTHIGLVNAAVRLDMAKRGAHGEEQHLRPSRNTRAITAQEPQAA